MKSSATAFRQADMPRSGHADMPPAHGVPADTPASTHAASGKGSAASDAWGRLRRSGSSMASKLYRAFDATPKSQGSGPSAPRQPASGAGAGRASSFRMTREPSMAPRSGPVSRSASLRALVPPRAKTKLDSPDIVFVGAGPVGLWGAIQLKLRKPELNILMYEKRDQYTRDNMVRLKTDLFAGCMLDDWNIIADLKFQLGESPFIPIRVLERTLLNLAKNLKVDIQIVPEGVGDVQSKILDDCPDATMIVGSDGAHSGVRTQMFGEGNYHKQPLRFAAHIKYDVDGPAQKTATKELYPLSKKMHHHLVKDHVGRYANGKTPVTLQMFIDEPTYASLKEAATSRNPVRIFSPEPHAAVAQDILDDVKSMLGLKIVNHGARIDPASVRLSVTEIPQHYCDSVVEPHGDQGRYKALLGDAAMGLSFFKGLNAGLKSASKFAVVVSSKWDLPRHPEEHAGEHKFSDYQAWFKTFSKDKIDDGNRQNLQYKRIDRFIEFNSKSRANLFQFSDKQLARFQTAADDLIAHPGVKFDYKKASVFIGR